MSNNKKLRGNNAILEKVHTNDNRTSIQYQEICQYLFVVPEKYYDPFRQTKQISGKKK